jgi:hypothetical protein
MRQTGLFGLSAQLKRLSDGGDPLETLVGKRPSLSGGCPRRHDGRQARRLFRRRKVIKVMGIQGRACALHGMGGVGQRFFAVASTVERAMGRIGTGGACRTVSPIAILMEARLWPSLVEWKFSPQSGFLLRKRRGYCAPQLLLYVV